MSTIQLLKDIKAKNINSLYVFDGEEPFYIDTLVDAFEKDLLSESEKDFNFCVLYGKDSDKNAVLNEIRKPPMFAEKTLVILKEASQFKELALLEPYLDSIPSTTVFVIAHKYKKIDARTSFGKKVKKLNALTTFDKVKEEHLHTWISNHCKENAIKIHPETIALLAQHIGNDLQQIANELEKISLNISSNEEITNEHIEKYVGISKDYNAFEFVNALAFKDYEKTARILNYFFAHSKEFPMVVLCGSMYYFFNNLYMFQFVKHKNDFEAAKEMGVNSFFLKDYRKASQYYDLEKSKQLIHHIAAYNLKSLGVNSNCSDTDLLKELTYKILAL